MNIAAIKKINEKMPYWMKWPFSKMIRKKLIKNQEFLNQYRKLMHADLMSEEAKNKIQVEMLKQILVHAYYHTKFYRQSFDELCIKPEDIQEVGDLTKLPILTKELVKVHYEDLQADNIYNSYEVSTGGTTGAPVRIAMEKDAIYREWAFVYHYWSKFGYDYRKSKLATFRGVDLGNKISVINPLYNEIRMNPFLMNRDNVLLYVNKIERYGAEYIYGYPSAVYNFCRLLKSTGHKMVNKYKSVFLISENLYPFQEEMISEILGCPIAMFYGHSERAVFGEKYNNGYIFNQMYGVTEINQSGIPIVTGFINRKMPLIRYQVDDEVSKKGRNEYRVTGHRDSEVVYGANGEQIRATMLDFHGLISKQISGFQFFQEVPGVLTFRVLSDNQDAEVIEEIRKEIEQKLGKNAKVNLQMVENLSGSRGKYRMVIQMIKSV